MQKIKIGKLLNRIKESIILQDDVAYKRVTIKSKNQGVTLRDVEFGVNIGTKKQFLIREGQFLLSKIDARNGAFGIVSKAIDGAIITGNFWTFEVNRELLNIEWFNIFVSSTYFIDICSKASSGTTNRQYLDEKKFLDFKIQLPSLYEQGIFVKQYKSMNEKFENVSNELINQQKYAQKLKGTILQEAIQGKLTSQNENDEPASVLLEKIRVEKEGLIKEKKIKKEKPLPRILDEEQPFELPNGWDWVRMGEICYVITDGDHQAPPQTTDGINFLVISNVSKGKLSFDNTRFVPKEYYDGLSELRKPKKGDILFTVTGSYGIPLIVDTDREFCFQRHIALLKPSLNIITKYLYWGLNSNLVKKQCDESATGTAQKTVSLTTLRNLKFPIPPLNEQKLIVEKVDQLMMLCDELEQNIEQSKQEAEKLMKAVLQEAFTVKEEVLN